MTSKPRGTHLSDVSRVASMVKCVASSPHSVREFFPGFSNGASFSIGGLWEVYMRRTFRGCLSWEEEWWMCVDTRGLPCRSGHVCIESCEAAQSHSLHCMHAMAWWGVLKHIVLHCCYIV